MKLTAGLIFLLDTQAKQGPERVRIYKSGPLSPRWENSAPETGRAPGDSLSRPLLSFPEREIETQRGEGICPIHKRAGSQAGIPDALATSPFPPLTQSWLHFSVPVGNRSLALRQRLLLGAGSRGRGRGALLCSPSPTRTCYILT